MNILSRYIVVQPRHTSWWEVRDDEDRICWRSGSKAKCAAVAEFLQDAIVSSSLEGTQAWIKAHGPRGR